MDRSTQFTPSVIITMCFWGTQGIMNVQYIDRSQQCIPWAIITMYILSAQDIMKTVSI